MACTCGPKCHRVHAVVVPSEAPLVRVVFGDESTCVDLQELVDNAPAVRLDRIWAAAKLAGAAPVAFDFIGEDGFSPSMRGHPPLDAAVLSRGFVRIRERRLEWDPALALPCVYRVRAFSRLVALAA
jgi:hypothetical protein